MSHGQPLSPSVDQLPPVDVPTPEEVCQIEADARRLRRRNGLVKIVTGAIFCALGLGVTVASYATVSQTGGTYLVWLGPVFGGAWLILRGVLNLRS